MNIRKVSAIAAAMVIAGAALAGDDKSTAEKMQWLDTDGDGRVSAAEYTAKDGRTLADFAQVDSDGDGFASRGELESHWAQHRGHKGRTEDASDYMTPAYDRVLPTEATDPVTTPATPATDAASKRPVDD